MSSRPAATGSGRHYAYALTCLVICLFSALGLYSYDWRDIGRLHQPPNDPPGNLIGPFGAWFSYLLFEAIGAGAYLIPVWLLVAGVILFMVPAARIRSKLIWAAVTVMAATALLELTPGLTHAAEQHLNLSAPTGLLGLLIVRGILVRWLSPIGAGILLGAGAMFAVVMFWEAHNVAAATHWLTEQGRLAWLKWRGAAITPPARMRDLDEQSRQLARQRERLERALPAAGAEASPRPTPAPRAVIARPDQPPATASALPTVAPAARAEAPVRPESACAAPVQAPPVVRPPAPAPRPSDAAKSERTPPAPKPPTKVVADAPATTVAAAPQPGDYALPPLALLDPVPPGRDKVVVDTETTSRILVATLAEFAIEAQITNVEIGPVVTRYELLPAAGVRIERIAALSNNLQLSLKATSLRVQAPVPGKGVVGIEVPNDVAKLVTVRGVLEGELWRSGKIEIPIVLGKDVAGNDLVADLAKMPHLLIAGATGSGKTVCMNAVLAGLLMARKPGELRLVLVDPKIVEFAVYNHLPHLVAPVITNPKKVALGLRWAINEMEKRYKLFARAGVRNIQGYNARKIVSQPDLFSGAAPEEKKEELPATVPYIVIVVDELADLMLADQAEIENCVARLAQLSRAVGIHMILSTQRPSVDVITGTIKANFPARIAFQVAQKTDSRTILDTVGAENLLGRGDMLFLPPGSSKPLRAQGAMVGDEEIRRICEFIRKQVPEPAYEQDIREKLEKGGSSSGGGGRGGGSDDDDGDGVDDELVNQSVAIIRETGRASTSSLQRRLRIGYTRAARIMDLLEERGIVGPPRGSDPREILIDLDGAVPENTASEPSDA